jgi:5-methylthioadenosine/S-adenosylhomocysteine deaminase
MKASELGVGIHIHVAESKEMAEEVQRDSGVSEIGLLEQLGLLDSDVLCAHC